MHMDNAEVVGGFAAFIFVLLMFLFILIVIGGIYVLTSIIYGKVFEKAGKEKNLAWIPFYREYIMCEVAELNWYWILVIYSPVLVSLLTCWIPFLGVFTSLICAVLAKIGSINLYYNINKKFKCEDVYLLLYILLPAFIPLGMMGFGEKYHYYKDAVVSPDGFLGDLGFINSKPKNNTTVNSEEKKEEAPEVIKEEEIKVTKEEVKETKKEEVKEATDVEEKPKKKTNTKKNEKKTTKKDE